jgi:hypothetical protein
MKLAELQANFQAGIVEGDQTILASIADSQKTDRATLFAVYYNAYRSRLAEFLSNDYPILRDYLGEEAFGHLVEDFIESTPSRHPNARWYGTRLPDFMHEAAAWRRNRSAIDLAQFERALAEAFDAADAPVSRIDALQDIRVEDRPRLVFEFHPSARLRDLVIGTMQIYAALAGDEEPPSIQEGEEAILFWRADGQIFYRPVVDDERLALVEAAQSKSFGDICALLAFQRYNVGVTQRVAGFLSQWFADGLVTRLSISD